MRQPLQRIRRRLNQSVLAARLRQLVRRLAGRDAAQAVSNPVSPPPAPPICESVKRWSAAHSDIECQTLLPAVSVNRPLPHTVEPALLDAYTAGQQQKLHEKYLVRLAGASVAGPNGLVILPDGAFAVESVYTLARLQQDPDYRAPDHRRTVWKPGNYFSLLAIWARYGGYYHWLHDSLQRLYGAVDVLPDDIRFIVWPDLRPWQRETLRLLGIRDDQLAFFDGAEVWRLENLFFSPATTHSGHSRPEVEAWLRDRLMSACGVKLGRAHRRIYITRRNIAKRRVENEDQVEACLRAYGFQTSAPEQLSFQDQIAFFAEAEFVVAPHGSALANILFAPPGLTVVDMVDSSMAKYAYVFWTLCGALGHQYWYLSAASVPREGHPPDTQVPIEKLEATLERIGLSRSRQPSRRHPYSQ